MKPMSKGSWVNYSKVRIWVTFIAAIVCFGISLTALIIELV